MHQSQDAKELGIGLVDLPGSSASRTVKEHQGHKAMSDYKREEAAETESERCLDMGTSLLESPYRGRPNNCEDKWLRAPPVRRSGRRLVSRLSPVFEKVNPATLHPFRPTLEHGPAGLLRWC